MWAEGTQHGPTPGMTSADTREKEAKAGWEKAIEEALPLTAEAVTGSLRAQPRHVLLALQHV